MASFFSFEAAGGPFQVPTEHHQTNLHEEAVI
jgi:hypothetical protein